MVINIWNSSKDIAEEAMAANSYQARIGFGLIKQEYATI